jgi:hypothetical protein
MSGTTERTEAPRFRLVELDDGRQWLTDGHVGMSPESAVRMLGILSELAECECSASISKGMLWMEDCTSYNLDEIVRKARA